VFFYGTSSDITKNITNNLFSLIRCYVSVVLLNNTIYAMGGFDGHHRLGSAEKYNFERNQWTLIAPMTTQRSDACAAVLNSKYDKTKINRRTIFMFNANVHQHRRNQTSKTWGAKSVNASQNLNNILLVHFKSAKFF
jgi:hypothetical protein